MFTRQQIDMEQVAVRLYALVAPAGGMVREMGGMLAKDQLLPQAHRIITKDVAKKLDEVTRNDTSRDVFIMLKEEQLNSLSSESVFLYVALLAEAVEDGIRSTKTMVRYYAATGGFEVLTKRADQADDNGQFVQGETARRLALACIKLFPYPDYRALSCLFNLGINLAKQKKSSKEILSCFKSVLYEYDRLDAKSKTIPEAKESRDEAADVLRRING